MKNNRKPKYTLGEKMWHSHHNQNQETTRKRNRINQEKIRIFGEKETYKYLGILEEDTIKQVEMKEKKLKKSVFGKRGDNSKPNYTAENSSKG